MMAIVTTDAAVNTAQTIAEHGEVFYQSPEFWVSASFVLVVCLLFGPISKVVKNLILSRIERIRQELQDAENLKTDAQNLYAEYERKFVNAENEAVEVMKNQQNFINQNKEKKLNELNLLLKRKQAEANARIELASELANDDVKAEICNKALKILYQVIRLKLTKADYNKLIENSITNIKKMNIGGKNG